MNKFKSQKILLFILSLLVFSACTRQLISASEELPMKPHSQIETAIQNWNEFYGANVQAVSWSYVGRITSEATRNEMVQVMTSPERAWFPSGDVSKPNEMTAARITDDPQISSQDITEWQNMVNEKVSVGQHVVEIKWTKGVESFTTICITDEQSIIYDSTLSNAVSGRRATGCFDYKMCWIWEMHKPCSEWTRGYITGGLVTNCKEGVPVTCEDDCSSSMTLGEVKIKCEERIVENCCKMDYSWAWACGFKSIKVGTDKFTLEVEGIIGSSGAGNGSCTECCD